ncbi:MAG: MFS transporter [Ardenticatenaceae bacterium]|nr:MFS transporter [Ardenticatenaceae bacterium]
MAEAAEYQPAVPAATGWAAVAPALRSRNFRLFWLAQIISTVGTSLQVVAEGWLIYNLTGSTFWLGAVGFIGLLPVVPVSFLGGVLIDRLPRRKLILATQSGLLLQAAVFGLLALSGGIRLWHIVVLYFVFGSLLAIDHPARRAFLVELVGRDELANAIALNATIFNVSSLVGYAVSGLLIATIGAGGTMLLNAATYLAPCYALAAIRVLDVGQDRERPALGVALSEGILTLWKQPALLGTISLMAIVGGLAWPVYGMMPAFARDVVQTNSVGLGLLLAAGALGSVLGTTVVTRLGSLPRGRTLAVVCLLLPVLVIGFALSSTLLVACLGLVAFGLVLLLVETLTITLVQINVSDRVRGRVMTLYSQVHAGSSTVGNVLIGGLAVHLGLPLALSLGGAVALLYVLGAQRAMPALRRLE